MNGSKQQLNNTTLVLWNNNKSIHHMNSVFKALLAVIGISSTLVSCSHVYFNEPQPKGGKRLKEIPAELCGVWMNEEKRYSIVASGFYESNIFMDTISMEMDTAVFWNPLSDTTRLYRAKDLFVYHNKRNGNPYWEISVLEVQKNGDVNLYYTDDPELFRYEKGLKLIEVSVNMNDTTLVMTEIPPLNDSTSVNYVVFDGQMKLKSLRKMVATPYLKYRFHKDGTLEEPEHVQD